MNSLGILVVGFFVGMISVLTVGCFIVVLVTAIDAIKERRK